MNNRMKRMCRPVLLALLCAHLIVPRAQALTETETQQVADSLRAAFQRAEDAADVPDSTATLADYLAYAANHNPALKAAFHDWYSGLERSGYAGALPDPVVSYGYFVEPIETRVGPQRQRFGLKQMLPWFGTLGSAKASEAAAANAAFQRFQAEKLRLFYRVKAAYFEFYLLDREIELTRDNLELMRFWEQVVRSKYRVGLQAHPDLIKAQVELGTLEDRVQTLTLKREPLESRLRAALGLPDQTPIATPRHGEESVPQPSRDSVVAWALAANPDLAAAGYDIEQADASVRLAGKAKYPDLTLGAEYIDIAAVDGSTMPDNGKDAWQVGVSLNLPLWFSANGARTGAAKAKRRAAEYRFTEARNQLVAYLAEVQFRYEDALRKLRLYRDGLVPKAEQLVAVTYTSYQAGESDFLSLLDAQRQLLDTQLKQEQALADLVVRRAQLEMLVGRELWATTEPAVDNASAEKD
jgi:cobalt-zinc-cadmium efflux system outer membrane protein